MFSASNFFKSHSVNNHLNNFPDPEFAIKEQGLAFARKASEVKLTYIKKGIKFIHVNNCHVYIALYKKALKYYEQANDLFCIAAAHQHIGYIYAKYLIPNLKLTYLDNYLTREEMFVEAITSYNIAAKYYSLLLNSKYLPFENIIAIKHSAKQHLSLELPCT